MLGSLGQEITQALDEARGLIVSDLMPDTYEIKRGVTRIADGSGGYTETPNIVESGRCRLDATQRLGSEGVSGNIIEAASAYVLYLPLTSTLTAADTVIINDTREFAVVSAPRRAGEWALTATADLEERS